MQAADGLVGSTPGAAPRAGWARWGCEVQTCGVVRAPETRYARSGDVHIAYQVVGGGGLDLVFSPSPVSNIEVAWEWPPFARFLDRLASFSRLILFDKRGTGLSDRVTEAATLEERMDDVRAVMDAAGSERAAIFGSSEGGPMALLFAATYPSRVSALVLYGSYAKAINSGDYQCGVDADLFEIGMELMAKEWGNCALIDVFSPTVRDDEDFRRWWGRYERQSASPGAAVAIQRLNARLDVRPVLPAIRVPTLVLYRAGEFVAHVEGSKYLAAHIAGAAFEELQGVDYHPFVGDQDAILDRVEGFLTGARRGPLSSRVLATILCVGGGLVLPGQGMPVLADHVGRFGGRLGTEPGGAAVATFDGPVRAISCALAVRDVLREIGVAVPIGGHLGEVERRGDEVTGTAVSIAAAVLARAEPGSILISRTLADVLAGAGFALVNAGEHDLAGVAGPWRLFSVAPVAGGGPALPGAAVPGRAGVFRREGDVWLLGLDGVPVRLRDTKGLADIARLLAYPNREAHVAELLGITGEMGLRPAADHRIDQQAIVAYRARLADLATEQDDAEAMHDVERAARARLERDALVERLSADLGLGGRARVHDDWAERARKAVRARIASALNRIDGEHPALGRHLRASIRTGAFCVYAPADPVTWQL